MSDLIKREDAIAAVQDHFNADGFRGYDDGQKMMDRINALPSAEPKGELIKREDAIEVLQKEIVFETANAIPYEDYDSGCIGGLKKAIRTIEKLPTADNWIPVSERLPQCGVGMHYLVTLKDGHCFKDNVYEAFFDKNGWHMGYNELADDDVIAWQPLPTPYMESEAQE